VLSQAPVNSAEFFTRVLPEMFSDPKALGGRTSRMSVCLRVDAEAYSLRIREGQLLVTPGRDPESLVSLMLTEADFPVLVSNVTAQLGDQRALLALQVLLAEEAAVAELSDLEGAVAFAVKDGETVRRLLLTLGRTEAAWSDAECVVTTELSDFLLVQKGEAHPVELLMQGKLQVQGDPALLMMLAPLFVNP
jgi:hypothetical protein